MLYAIRSSILIDVVFLYRILSHHVRKWFEKRHCPERALLWLTWLSPLGAWWWVLVHVIRLSYQHSLTRRGSVAATSYNFSIESMIFSCMVWMLFDDLGLRSTSLKNQCTCSRFLTEWLLRATDCFPRRRAKAAAAAGRKGSGGGRADSDARCGKTALSLPARNPRCRNRALPPWRCGSVLPNAVAEQCHNNIISLSISLSIYLYLSISLYIYICIHTLTYTCIHMGRTKCVANLRCEALRGR